MPSKSQAQHRYVAVQAGEGKQWAMDWLMKDKGKTKGLPQHVPKSKRKKWKAHRQ